jgi:hypothetical protein
MTPSLQLWTHRPPAAPNVILPKQPMPLRKGGSHEGRTPKKEAGEFSPRTDEKLTELAKGDVSPEAAGT